jgi:hypothetical protein
MQITVHIGINICKTDSHPGIIRFIKSSYSFLHYVSSRLNTRKA